MVDVLDARLPTEEPLRRSLAIYGRRLGIVLAVALANGLVLVLLWLGVTHPFPGGLLLGVVITSVATMFLWREGLAVKEAIRISEEGFVAGDLAHDEIGQAPPRVVALSLLARALIREDLAQEHGLERIARALTRAESEDEARRRLMAAIDRALQDLAAQTEGQEDPALRNHVRRVIDVLHELRTQAP